MSRTQRNFWLAALLTCFTLLALVTTSLASPAFASVRFDSRTSTQQCPTYHTIHDQLTQTRSKNIITARHRGNFSADIPENSLGAFIQSFRACQPAVETDIRLTKDKQLVLFHDLTTGKMLEPDFNPELNKGSNPRLNTYTLQQLQTKPLLTRDRKATSWEVPTVNQLLQTMVNEKANSLVFFEVKEAEALVPTIQTISAFAQQHPTENITKRVIVKFAMDNFPTPADWEKKLAELGIEEKIMAEPVMNSQVAKRIDEKIQLPDPPEMKLPTNSTRALAAWAKAPAALAPVINVRLKDSSDFIQVSHRLSKNFEDFVAPREFTVENTKPGTMAHMVALLRYFQKGLEVFVPVPDWVLFHREVSFGITVPNTFGDKVPINSNTAYFNNTSECCYALKDRLEQSVYAHEHTDLRSNLDWMFLVEPTVITTDDSDSVEVYAEQAGQLNTIARPTTHFAPDDMQSSLQYRIRGKPVPNSSLVQLKAWNGGRSDAWGGQVCIWSSPNSYPWAVKCHMQPSGGYTDELEISVSAPGKIRIRDTQTWQCLNWKPGEREVFYWNSDCLGAGSQWTRTADGRFLTGEGRAISFGWQDRYYWGIPYAYLQPAYDTSSWARWQLHLVK